MNNLIIYGITTAIAIVPVGGLYVYFMKRLKEIKRANGFDTMDTFIRSGCGEDIHGHKIVH